MTDRTAVAAAARVRYERITSASLAVKGKNVALIDIPELMADPARRLLELTPREVALEALAELRDAGVGGVLIAKLRGVLCGTH